MRDSNWVDQKSRTEPTASDRDRANYGNSRSSTGGHSSSRSPQIAALRAGAGSKGLPTIVVAGPLTIERLV
jgi:hypothetical protein